MKEFVVAVFRPKEFVGYSSQLFTVKSPSIESVIRNFWTLEGDGVYEDEDYKGSVTIYDFELKRVVYRYGCGE